VALHFAVATPNFVIQEEMAGCVPWYFDVVRTPIRMEAGYWEVPTPPGLGVEVDLKEAKKHPFAPVEQTLRPAVLHDGGFVTR
jgi:galactonate dehydratase